MEGTKDVKLDGSPGDETEKGVVCIDLHLAALKVRPAHFRATIQQERKVLPP